MDAIKLGPNNYRYSPSLVDYFGCAQASTDQNVLNRGTGGVNGAKGTGQTYDTVTGTYGIWGTSHRIRSYAHSDATRAPTLPANGVLSRYLSATDSVVVALRGEFTLPGSSTPFLRLGAVTVPGFRFQVGSTGTVQWWIRMGGAGAEVQLTNSSRQLAGSVSETVLAVFDGVAKTCRMWINGLEVAAVDTLPAGLLFTADTFAGAIGASGSGGIALATQELQIYVSRSLPSNISTLAAWWHTRPYRPFSNIEMPS